MKRPAAVVVAAKRAAVVIVAAGSGERLGLGLPKALAPYRGLTVLGVALANVCAIERDVDIIVVAPETHLRACADIAAAQVAGTGHSVTVVTGASTRQQSVACGIAAVPDDASTILIHDAARANTPAQTFDAVIAHVEATGRGAIPGLPVVDSVKRATPGERLEAVDRSNLYTVQTPQGFPADMLRDAYAAATREHTDDAGLVTEWGGAVDVIPGTGVAAKITYPSDLSDPADHGKDVAVTGVGVDIHQFDTTSDRPLRVAGVDWPGEPPLAGHSDGDVVLHAICDALLSAAHLGDLGTHFGSARPEFTDADSAVFVAETLRLVADAGYRVVAVSVQLVGERPRIANRRVDVENHLSALVGAPVSFAATTTDKLGFLGHPDGLAAVATATIRPETRP